jgi:hypothetical protein
MAAVVLSWAVGAAMVRYKGSDYTQTVMVRVPLDNRLLPGISEFASQALIEQRSDTAIFGSRYKHDETGCPADDPKILLKVILLASARGLISFNKIEQACRENSRHCQLIYTDAIPGQERGGLPSLFPSGSQSRGRDLPPALKSVL